MKFYYILLLVIIFSCNETIAQWNLQYEFPDSMELRDFMVHEPSGKYLMLVTDDTNYDYFLWEYDNGIVTDITPFNEDLGYIDFQIATAEGHIIVEVEPSDSYKFVYNGNSLIPFPTVDPPSLSLDAEGRIFYFETHINHAMCYYFENQVWDSVGIDGSFRYISEIDENNISYPSIIYSSPDGTVPFGFTDDNSHEHLYYFDNGSFISIPFNEVVESFTSVEFFNSGELFFYTKDSTDITRLYQYDNHIVTPIITPQSRYSPSLLHRDSLGITYWHVRDAGYNSYLTRYNGTMSHITPSHDQESYDFILEKDNLLIFSSHDTLDRSGSLWASINRGNSWLEVTPDSVIGNMNLLAVSDSLVVLTEGYPAPGGMLHIFHHNNWNSELLIDTTLYSGYLSYRESIGSDSLIIVANYATQLDSFYLITKSGIENITPILPMDVTDILYLDFYPGVGHLFRSTSSNGEESFALRTTVGTADITPEGSWENLIGLRNVDKGFYSGNILGQSREDVLFYFSDWQMHIGVDSGHTANYREHTDWNHRIYYVQEGDKPQLKEANGDAVYNLTLFNDALDDVEIMDFNQSANELVVKIGRTLYTYKINEAEYDPCSADHMIPHHNPLDVQVYSAKQSIYIQEHIRSSASPIFIANESIIFKSGFEVELGAELESSISDDCNSSP